MLSESGFALLYEYAYSIDLLVVLCRSKIISKVRVVVVDYNYPSIRSIPSALIKYHYINRLYSEKKQLVGGWSKGY